MSSVRNTRKQIRFEHNGGELDVLVNYLDGVTCIANLLPQKSDKFAIYKNAAELLYEVICDPLVSSQWRYTCLDHLYKPLLNAERYACTESDRITLARLKIDMHVLVPHFL